MEEDEVSEVAIRLNDIGLLDETAAALTQQLDAIHNQQDKPVFEIHTWQKLTPFFNIVKMIDLMTFFIKIMLVAIVLVSIMNVMVMAVYERINEIGTIAAIGTGPGKILALFLSEGLLLGIIGTIFGILVYLATVAFLNLSPISYDFGNQQGLILSPSISLMEIVSISLIVVAISVLGSLQPAWKAAKMDPITALRHV
jgi:putative ABC transport system permease protein